MPSDRVARRDTGGKFEARATPARTARLSMTSPEPPRKRSISLPLAILGFVAGIVTVVIAVRLARAWW